LSPPGSSGVGAVLSLLLSSLSFSSYLVPCTEDAYEGLVLPTPHEGRLVRASLRLETAKCCSPRGAPRHEGLPLLGLYGLPSLPTPCRCRWVVEQVHRDTKNPVHRQSACGELSWEFRDSSHGVAYRRGSTVVTMGPARDCANGDTSVYPGSGPSRVEVKPLLPACFILSRH
jgi:hypothetical protein